MFVYRLNGHVYRPLGAGRRKRLKQVRDDAFARRECLLGSHISEGTAQLQVPFFLCLTSSEEPFIVLEMTKLSFPVGGRIRIALKPTPRSRILSRFLLRIIIEAQRT